MWYNPIITAILKSPFNWLVSYDMLLLTYTGRKSGQTYQTPLSYVEYDNEAGEQQLLTISKASRTWWRNLRGGANVTLRLRGKDRPAHAEVFEGVAAIPELTRYFRDSPSMAKALDVRLDTTKEPLVEDVRKASEAWVMVRFSLAPLKG